MADPGTYGDRVNACGCTSLPEGQHLPTCSQSTGVKEAPRCAHCGCSGKDDKPGYCPFCGAKRLGGPIK